MWSCCEGQVVPGGHGEIFRSLTRLPFFIAKRRWQSEARLEVSFVKLSQTGSYAGPSSQASAGPKGRARFATGRNYRSVQAMDGFKKIRAAAGLDGGKRIRHFSVECSQVPSGLTNGGTRPQGLRPKVRSGDVCAIRPAVHTVGMAGDRRRDRMCDIGLRR